MKELSDKEVLEAAIEKAIDRGYVLLLDNTRGDLKHPREMIEWIITENRSDLVIFDHDFARALWGTELKPFSLLWTRFEDREIPFTRPLLPKDDPHQIAWAAENHRVQAWQWHLQRMAIAEDRIDYLRRNI